MNVRTRFLFGPAGDDMASIDLTKDQAKELADVLSHSAHTDIERELYVALCEWRAREK